VNTTPSKRPPGAGRGTVQLLIARAVFLVSGFLISVILARGLGPVAFGVYGVLMSLLIWIEMVLAAGVPGATAKMLSDRPGEAAAVEQSAHVLLVAWSVALFLGCWFMAPKLAEWFEVPSGVALLRLTILDIPLMAVCLAYQGILNGRQLFGLLSATVIIQTLSKLFGILIGVSARGVATLG
jgi:O-antigen/teichoic acid export membrane protein